jgi:acyl carrier protein
MTQYRTSLDDYAMTVQEAMDATGRVLRNFGAGQIIVATGNLEKRFQIWTQSEKAESDVSNPGPQTIDRNPRPALKSVYVAPRNDTERELARIWEEFLAMDKVGAHDDFFELGGHSLLATKLVAQVRARMKMELPLAKFFEGPTVAKIAEALGEPAGLKQGPTVQS